MYICSFPEFVLLVYSYREMYVNRFQLFCLFYSDHRPNAVIALFGSPDFGKQWHTGDKPYSS